MSSGTRVIKAKDAQLAPLESKDRTSPDWNEPAARPDTARPGNPTRNDIAEALTRRAQALLAEAEASAQSILSEARDRANRLIDEALAGATRISEEARSIGRREGLEAGRQEALAEAEALAQRAREEARSLVEGAVSERHQILVGAKEEMVNLTMATVRRILHSEISARPEAIGDMITAALDKVRGQEEITVKVSPGDASCVEGRRGEWLSNLPGTRSLEVFAEEGLGPGDFGIQTDQGYVDGRVNRQVEEIEEGLRSGDTQG